MAWLVSCVASAMPTACHATETVTTMRCLERAMRNGDDSQAMLIQRAWCNAAE